MMRDRLHAASSRIVPFLRWEGPSGPSKRPLEEEAVLLRSLDHPLFVLCSGDRTVTLEKSGTLCASGDRVCLGILPAAPVDHLGDPGFVRDYGVRFAYYAGAMAHGIHSEEMVIALGSQRILGSFGAGGMRVERIEDGLRRIQEHIPDGPFAVNLLHNPSEPTWEMDCVKLFLSRRVRVVEASAFVNLSPAIVYYRVKGLARSADNTILRQSRIIAKVSRREVAQHFLHPAPEPILRRLLADGLVTAEQAQLASLVPMADDITVEGDSGGHTDSGVLSCVFQSIVELRDEISHDRQYPFRVRVGAAGGIGNPHAVLAAFALGAAFIATGSINQACVEAKTSPQVKRLLAKAKTADVALAPSGDRFEAGAKVQVLKSGTLFAPRAQKLYALYKQYDRIEDVPLEELETVEKSIFRQPLDQVWADTVAFFRSRGDHRTLSAAEADPKKRMALLFRWYLGNSSRWAIAGDAERAMDFQIWCGPAIGAANEWLKGSQYEAVENRRVAVLAGALMNGAAYLARVAALRQMGVHVPEQLARCPPEEFSTPTQSAPTAPSSTASSSTASSSTDERCSSQQGEPLMMNVSTTPAKADPDTKLKLKVSKDYYKKCWELMPGGTHYNFGDPERPLVIPFHRGKNSRVWDLDGNEHLDLFCKFGALLVGHGNEAYNKSLVDYMQKVMSVDTCDLELDVCSTMIKHIPCAEMVRFCLSGTEAVQNALRLARAFTGKERFVRFHGHYHGNADNIMGGRPKRDLEFPVPEQYQGDLMDTLGRAKGVLQDQSFIIYWNDIDLIEQTLSRHHKEIAAILMEPICINGGGILPGEGYLERVKELCEKHNIVLIFDEIITGIRLGLGGAQKLLGVTPHLATFGKALGGGAMPISAIAGERRIMDLYTRGKVIHAGTFNGYPLGLAAIKATFDLIEKDPGCYDRMARITEQISNIFVRAAHAVDLPLVVQGMPTALVYHSQDTVVEQSQGYSDRAKLCDIMIREICKRYGIQFSPLSRIYSNMLMTQDDVTFFEERIFDAMENAKTVIELTFKERDLA